MQDVESLHRRVAALSEVGLEGPGADEAAAELEAIADEVEAHLNPGRENPSGRIPDGGGVG